MNYTINNYRVRKVKNNYFVTTDHGSHCILDETELKQLKSNKINNQLKNKLMEREILLDDKNIDETIRLTKNRNNFLFGGTSLHIVVVTLRCNMNCIYCHASSKNIAEKSYDMNEETGKKTVDFIFQTPNNSITIEFQGGEPLLNWNIIKFITKYAQEKNEIAKKYLKISLVTNLSLMDDEKLNFLIENKIDICTSLDGPKEVHDYNRTLIGNSNYEQVINWIKKIKEEYKKNDIDENMVNALVTLTKKSLEYPKEIIDEYVNLGLKNIHLRFLNKLGVAKHSWDKISYSVDEYLSFWKKAVEYIEELKKQNIKINERIVNIMLQKFNSEFDPNYLELRSPCGAAIGQLAYDYNGDIYTCDEARMIDDDIFKLGTVDEKYKDIVTCDKACALVNASINDQYYCDNCAYKPFCGICPVCNFAEQNNIIAKISVTSRCKIFIKQFDWVVEKFIKE